MTTEYSGIQPSLRQQVFKLLGKNPLLKPLDICKFLGLDRGKNQRDVIQQYKKQWRREYQVQQGSIRSLPDGVHNVFFKGKLFVRDGFFEVLRGKGVTLGWVLSRARNRYWIYRSVLGRVRFFENGTVELFVRKPASEGKAMQLFSDGFVKSELVTDIRVLEKFQKGLMRRFHGTFDAGQRLPYMKVTAFEDTHKLVFVAGDKTHPTCYEFIVEYHKEVEWARQFLDMLSGLGLSMKENGEPKSLRQDYSR